MTITSRAGLLGLGIIVGGVMVASAATSTDSTSTPKRGGEMKMRVQEMRQQIQSRIMTEREEVKKKAMQFKDEKKKQAAEALYDRLQKVNETWTGHFGDVLDKYTAILGKVSERKTASSSAEVMAKVDAALQNASDAIQAARVAVEAQAKKIYSVEISSEAAARAAFRTAHDNLKKDLFALRDGAMRNAQEAAHRAIQSLRPASSSATRSSQ